MLRISRQWKVKSKKKALAGWQGGNTGSAEQWSKIGQRSHRLERIFVGNVDYAAITRAPPIRTSSSSIVLLTNGTPLSRLGPFTVVLRTRDAFALYFQHQWENISEERHRFIKTRLLMSILTCFQWGKGKAPVQAVRRISKLCLYRGPQRAYCHAHGL